MRVQIEKLVYGGSGLARTPQGIVFVPRSVPGDLVEVRVVENRNDYSVATIVEIVERSPDRVLPSCENFESAGCCHWQHIRYDRQIEIKTEILRETLKRLGKISWDAPIPCRSGPPEAYRLRAQFHVRQGQMGYFRENSNDLVPIRSCSALAPEIAAFLTAVDRDSQDLFEGLREVRVAGASGRLASTWVYAEGRERPWDRVRDEVFRLPGMASGTFESGPRQAHYRTDRPVVQAAGLAFGLSSDAFFQSNRYLLEGFLRDVATEAGASPGRVLDLYCGSAFFTSALARTNATEVLGVESDAAAVRQAERNLKLNESVSARIVKGDVESYLRERSPAADTVILNPPRGGSGRSVMHLIGRTGAARVVYVSCNPSTLAPDAARLISAGFALQQVKLVDQFPNTYHIETVATFVR